MSTSPRSGAAQARTGQQYLSAIDDGRQVFINGQCLTRHSQHPAFSGAVASVAGLYDYQASHLEDMTFDLDGQRRVSKAWELPQRHEQLLGRAHASLAWARQSLGWLGRSPDHVSAALSGMLTHIEVFEAHCPDRAAALKSYFAYARERDLYLTYTIVNPQGDRSRSPGEHAQNLYHTLGVVKETDAGVIVTGAKMLGTAAVLADEVLVGVQNPLKPGVDERYALSFALPLNTPGIKILSRVSYAEGSNRFDHPLSSRFDENDALIYFDNVLVPWERLFVYGDTGMCRRQFHSTAAEVLMDTQSLARLTTKLHFLTGLAQRMTEITGVSDFPAVRELLGEMACNTLMIEGLFKSLIHCPVTQGKYVVPDKKHLYMCQAVAQSVYPKFIETLRKLAGGGVIMLPSSVDDLANPQARALMEQTQYSSVASPLERVQVMKLAWDAMGSEFGSRHLQYEMFYSGPHFVALSRVHSEYDWEGAKALACSALAETAEFR
ncbi:4-hydroxyphenylacetate 3-hydroxylase family protein [Pseudomonas cremoricolorata]|uniref:4-hydroxyphenylacetate 3-hydroxylase family protein n=1 Tax=Pseudomonas cremoricolorata TaxID=157783 RepID=UPI00067689CE|nr:4-hydroxyphenylacetate 3-hydroxylase N-terminal domain-containing protein [Pseudomonas cremoricolorata]